MLISIYYAIWSWLGSHLQEQNLCRCKVCAGASDSQVLGSSVSWAGWGPLVIDIQCTVVRYQMGMLN